MRQTRSFVIAAMAACSLLLAASFGAAAKEVAGAPSTIAASAQAQPAAPDRLPFVIIGVASLGAGAVLLRRAPKLV